MQWEQELKGLEELLKTTCKEIGKNEEYLARVASDIANIGQSKCSG
jgi:hypothetical protein